MASNISAIALLFLIFIATFTSACNTCKTSSPPSKVSPSSPPSDLFCPMDILKLGMCGNLLNSGLRNLVVGGQPSSQCCALFDGLDDLGAVTCICEALKANLLGINIQWSVSIKLLIDTCGKSIPPSFNCA
ncbi:hypothetical protein IFM89_022490 [Coptis chinensis]|uniref:Bifunctional inhibitor/plant lipid transfer protein/seed storage helical domain-containing protein n=1 Tax=Coptis chinensis TaxID=261450 RepID=A0A835IER7_9MAGN|nr:hypothetical protein IFM89_022490 [Coptis chinensis]